MSKKTKEKTSERDEQEREEMNTTTNESKEENEDQIEENIEENLQDIEQNEVDQLNQKINDLQNRLLRSHADFENFKKRTKAEKEELAKYASVKLIEALLPAYDNFERALKSSSEAKNYEALTQGVEMVYRQLYDALIHEGLEAIDSVGQPFNPEIHQAVMQVESDEFDSGTVVEELQKGYKFKGKVIRPSMVKVNL